MIPDDKQEVFVWANGIWCKPKDIIVNITSTHQFLITPVRPTEEYQWLGDDYAVLLAPVEYDATEIDVLVCDLVDKWGSEWFAMTKKEA